MDLFFTLIFYTMIMLVVMISYRYKWKKYNWMAIFVLTLVLGLRGTINDTLGDINVYWYYINNNAGLFDPKYYEPFYDSALDRTMRAEWFYLVLYKILKILPHTSVIGLSSIAFLSIVFLDRFIQRFKRREKELIIFFFFTQLVFANMTNGMRQMFAIMAFFNCVPLIEKRNFKLYIIYVLLLYSLHKSAILMIPFYFLRVDFLKNPLIQFGIFVVIFSLTSTLTGYLKGYMDAAYLLLSGSDAMNFQYLSSEEQVLEQNRSIIGGLFHFINMIFLTTNSKKFKNQYGTLGIIIYNFALLGYYILYFQFNIGIIRVNLYFTSFLFIVLGLMTYQSFWGYNKGNGKMQALTVVLIVFYIAWFVKSIFNQAGGYAPYLLNPEI